MALCFSSSKRHMRCFTGLEPRWIFKVCSVTFLGMPGISEGFHAKDVFVVAEEVNERAFLFRGEHGTNAYCFTLRAAKIYEDLLGALCRFERPGRLLCIGHFFGDLLLEGGEFPEAIIAVAWPQHSTSHS